MTSTIPHQAGMLHLGNVAQQMGRNAEGMDGKFLNKVAIGCICITALAGAAQVFIALKDSLDRKHESQREYHRPGNFTERFDRDEASRRSRS